MKHMHTILLTLCDDFLGHLGSGDQGLNIQLMVPGVNQRKGH